jgi:hypothetical protein
MGMVARKLKVNKMLTRAVETFVWLLIDLFFVILVMITLAVIPANIEDTIAVRKKK